MRRRLTSFFCFFLSLINNTKQSVFYNNKKKFYYLPTYKSYRGNPKSVWSSFQLAPNRVQVNPFPIIIIKELQSWTNSLGQYSVLSFKSLFITYFWVILQPPPPIQCLLGGNKGEIVCGAETGPVYAQH